MDIYYKHYIIIDIDGNIIDGFSEAFRKPDKNSILINEKGSYQFRLFEHGEENPSLLTHDEIPLYKWSMKYVVERSTYEIQKERDKRLPIVMAATIRAQRNSLLMDSDKTQLLDFPATDETRKQFAKYRQALRDLPEQKNFPFEIEWPEQPIIKYER